MTASEKIQNAQEQIAQIEKEAAAEREQLQAKSAWLVKETFRVIVRSKNAPITKEEQIALIIDRKYMIRIRGLNRWIEELQAR